MARTLGPYYKEEEFIECEKDIEIQNEELEACNAKIKLKKYEVEDAEEELRNLRKAAETLENLKN